MESSATFSGRAVQRLLRRSPCAYPPSLQIASRDFFSDPSLGLPSVFTDVS